MTVAPNAPAPNGRRAFRSAVWENSFIVFALHLVPRQRWVRRGIGIDPESPE